MNKLYTGGTNNQNLYNTYENGVPYGNSYGTHSQYPSTQKSCPAISVAKNCMQPSFIRSFDLLQKMSLERQCAAKNCCWDNDRYSKNILSNQMGAQSARLICPWHISTYSYMGMPSLHESLKGKFTIYLFFSSNVFSSLRGYATLI